MTNNTLPKGEIRDFLLSLKGKFFTIEFTKRSTGEHRVMTATTNYQKHLKGGQASYDFIEKGLLPVWDTKAKGFRSIPLDSVLVIRAKGNSYHIIATINGIDLVEIIIAFIIGRGFQKLLDNSIIS